jgi:hypothetical protein
MPVTAQLLTADLSLKAFSSVPLVAACEIL